MFVITEFYIKKFYFELISATYQNIKVRILESICKKIITPRFSTHPRHSMNVLAICAYGAATTL